VTIEFDREQSTSYFESYQSCVVVYSFCLIIFWP